MKLRKFLPIFLTIASVTALFTVNPTLVSASNKKLSTTKVRNNTKQYVIKNIPQLSKWGYILKIDADDQPVYAGKSSYYKMLNNPNFKGIQVIRSKKLKNVKFKIVKMMAFKSKNVNGGVPQYLITSKNHQYSTWATGAILNYYALNSKALRPVVKPLNRLFARNSKRLDKKFMIQDNVSGRQRIKKNEHDFNLAVKAAKRLKGNQRKFVLASLKQMKKNGDVRTVMEKINNNLLLWDLG